MDTFKIISSTKCGTLDELMQAMFDARDNDPRGKAVAECTAVQIDNKFIQFEVREFEDGTREYALSGV